MLISLPDILLVERENEKIKKMNKQFNENLPSFKLSNDQTFFVRLVQKLLEEQVLEIRFAKHKFRNSFENKFSWPWTMSQDFNHLSRTTRNSILDKSFTRKLKKEISGLHPHIDQAIPCRNCQLDLVNNSLPVNLECLEDELGDTETMTQFKTNRKRENFIPKESNKIHGLVCDVALDMERDEGKTFSEPLSNFIKDILSGKTFETSLLINQLATVTDSRIFMT
jgi:hypothetical protein